MILALTHASKPDFWKGLLDKKSTRNLLVVMLIRDNSTNYTSIMFAMHHSISAPLASNGGDE